MSVASPPPPPATDAARSHPRAGGRTDWPRLAAWVALGTLLAVNLPGFLCMGLDSDILMYDLCARRVLAGDVHYRDLLETNFPGIVWIHMAIRSVFGWRPEVLRAADLAIVATSIWLLTRWLPRSGPAWGRVVTATVLFAVYLSTSEWCHCQRDVWMLLPALAALGLRARQVKQLTRADVGLIRLAAWASLEGALWAGACWIKPFVAVPALGVWLVSAREIRRSAGWRRLSADLIGLLAGGMAVGAAGVGWLVATGAWPAFYEVMFVWNREYFTYQIYGAESQWAPVWMAVRLFPWILVHFFAVPLAAAAIWRGGRGGSISPLLAACYLGWLLQAIALQHVFDYVHVPPLFLGLTVLAADTLGRVGTGGGRPVLAFLAVCVLWSGYAVWAPRARAWQECLAAGSTPAVRDRLTLMHRVSWTDLERVAEFLREEDVQDGEVTCFSLSTVSLYGELDLRPSTRYLFLHDHLDIFASRRPVIHQALVDSRQKFLVVDLKRYKTEALRELFDREGGPGPTYPYFDRVAFRSGQYVVFRIDGFEMPDWLADPFGL
jgi:hypothetical protein